MKRTIFLLALLLVLAAPAAAQFTQVSGTITDPGGIPYANATVSMRLVPTGTAPTVGGVQFSATTAAATNAAGTFIARLADNNLVTPGGTQWEFTVSIFPGIPSPLGTGSQSFTVAPITITGATQSVSAALTAAAPALTNFVGAAGANINLSNLGVGTVAINTDLSFDVTGNKTIGFTAASATARSLSIVGNTSSGVGAGGALSITAGSAGALGSGGGTLGLSAGGGGFGNGGSVIITGATPAAGSGTGGTITIQAGSSGDGTSAAGNVNINAGASGFPIGKVAIGSRLELRAGTTAALTAPLYLQSSVLMTTPEAYALESDNTNLFFTIPAGPARKTIVFLDMLSSGASAGVLSAADYVIFSAKAAPDLSNLSNPTSINRSLLFSATGFNIGSALVPVDNIYYNNLIGSGPTTFEGAVAACTAAGALNGKIAFTSTGPEWSYNTGACFPIFHAGNDNDFLAHYFNMTHIVAPGSPAANNYRIYVDSTSFLLACKNSAGANCMPAGIASINADSTAAQTIVAAGTGTDFTVSTAAGATTIAIPSASATARGLITTGTQTIAGDKTVTGSLTISGNFSFSSTVHSVRTTAVTGTLTTRTADTNSAGTIGQMETRGGDSTNASGAGGAFLARGGDTSGTGVGGNATLRSGGSSNATPGAPGILRIEQTAKDGGTVTSGAVQCVSADLSVTDCGTSATNPVGIATTTTDPVLLQQFIGLNAVTIPLDVTSAGDCNGTNCTTTVGHYVCTSANVAGQVQVQSTACAAGRQVGIIFDAEATVTVLAVRAVALQRM